MSARRKPMPDALVVCLIRDGVVVHRLCADNGLKAAVHVVGIALSMRTMQPGDQITINLAADALPGGSAD